jgi:hypothetical protein
MHNHRRARRCLEKGPARVEGQDLHPCEKKPTPKADANKPASALREDAWDVFADDADELPEPEYGDFWPNREEDDEV